MGIAIVMVGGFEEIVQPSRTTTSGLKTIPTVVGLIRKGLRVTAMELLVM